MKRIFVLAVVALSACVSKGTHEALQKQFDETQAALKQKGDENSQLQQTLDAEKKHGQELDARIRELEAKLASAQAELDATAKAKTALEADKSQMLKDRTRLQASVEEMKAALADLSKRKAESEARLAEYRGLLERFKALIDAGKLQVKIVDGRMVVALASDVLFDSGSANLHKEGKAEITEVAGVLASIPNRKFQIEGHTDNVPIKSATYPSNWELAAARAITVLKTVVDAGMPAQRISAASFGESKPAQSNETPEGRSANRRIEIVVVPDLSSLPGFEELKKVSAQ